MLADTSRLFAALRGAGAGRVPFGLSDASREVIGDRLAIGLVVRIAGLKLAERPAVLEEGTNVVAAPQAGGAHRRHLLLQEKFENGGRTITCRREGVNPLDDGGTLGGELECAVALPNPGPEHVAFDVPA